jgi:hypothetical protein
MYVKSEYEFLKCGKLQKQTHRKSAIQEMLIPDGTM